MEEIRLTDEQKGIIEQSATSRALVEAGPGTGKTEVVAWRLAHLIGATGELGPGQVLVLSFSRSAVKALVNRIRNLKICDERVVEELRHISIRTFDSWTFRILRLLGNDPHGLLAECHDENIRKLIREIRERGEELLDLPELRLANVRHLIVDEFQDLTGLRAGLVRDLLKLLANPEGNSPRRLGFTLLGDPNQAIYEWTGSNAGNEGITSGKLLEWVRTEYPDLKTLRLTVNQRSTDDISELVSRASGIIDKAERSRKNPCEELEKFLVKELGTGNLDEVLLRIGNEGRPPQTAILCRSNSEVLNIGLRIDEKLPGKASILNIGTGGAPRVIPSWVAGLFHRFKGEQVTKSSFRKIFEKCTQENHFSLPCDGNWEAAWGLLLNASRVSDREQVLGMARLRERISWPDSLPDDEGVSNGRITVTTIHKSKGLEFEQVHIVRGDNHEEAEEARILFVGISRARKKLELIEPDESKRFYVKNFGGDNRKRWHRWFRGGLQNLEIGLESDIELASFVSTEVHGGEEGGRKIQKLLLEKQDQLLGRELVLHKTQLPGERLRFIYEINLKDEIDGVILLGRTCPSLTYDLLKIKHERQSLPVNIYGLRVRNIVTLIGRNHEGRTIPSPWNESRIWLGVNIHGISQFKLFWKRRD